MAHQVDLEEHLSALPRSAEGNPPVGEVEPLRERSVQSIYLDEHGREQPNPTPMQPPIGYKKHPTIAEQMRAMIAQASYEAAMAGAETEEEANDFDVGEDFDPTTPYEHDFDPDPVLEVMTALQSRPPLAAQPPASPTQQSPVPSAPHPSSAPAGPAE